MRHRAQLKVVFEDVQDSLIKIAQTRSHSHVHQQVSGYKAFTRSQRKVPFESQRHNSQ